MASKNYDEIFAAAVPKEMWDAVLTKISEAAFTGEASEGLTILDQRLLNVTNAEIEGTIEINGEEHWFHVESGDWNGTVIRGWNDGPGINNEPVEPQIPTPTQARQNSLTGVSATEALLEEWDNVLQQRGEIGQKISNLITRYYSDRFSDPGPGGGRRAREDMEKAGYELSDKVDADRIRASFFDTIIGFTPSIAIAQTEAPEELLADWRAARDKTSAIGKKIEALRQTMFKRMNLDGYRLPRPDETAAFKALGYINCDRHTEFGTLHALISRTIRIEKIPGFDYSTIPEPPMRELFRRLDPALTPPVSLAAHEARAKRIAEETLIGVTRKMAQANLTEVPESTREWLAEYGYTIAPRIPAPEPLEPGMEI